MAITGVKSIHYRMADGEQLQRSRAFFSEFGLTVQTDTTQEVTFCLPDGAHVRLQAADVAAFKTPVTVETIWGVNTPEALAHLVESLSRDLDLKQDERGDWRFVTPCGLPMGIGLFDRRVPVSRPDPLNAPGNIQRLNQWRKWRFRAQPKTVNHVVYGVDSYKDSWDFFRHRLGFRMSDHSKGLGVFLRADGANEHHNLFLSNAHYRAPSETSFQHACFGVEDIDELMVGANHMHRQGHVSKFGVGRHRIASALFWYVDCPAGGEAEYGADTDYLDDGWVPREWDAKFGFIGWASNLPPFMQEEALRDVRLLESEDDAMVPELAPHQRRKSP